MEELYCPICTEAYYFVKPRVLPCGHSICESCLKVLLTQMQFKCYYCKTKILEDNKVWCPVNFALWTVCKKLLSSDHVMVNQNEAEGYRIYVKREVENRRIRNTEQSENCMVTLVIDDQQLTQPITQNKVQQSELPKKPKRATRAKKIRRPISSK